MKAKNLFILTCFLGVLLFAVGYISYTKGRKSQTNKQVKTEIKQSEKVVDAYTRKYDSIQLAYSELEKQKQEVKTVYVKGKETVKYITKERIESYTDTLCKKDVLSLKNQLTVCDSLVFIQEDQLLQKMQQLNLSTQIIKEKDRQISLYKSKKPTPKPLGIGLIAGYGTDFKNGLTPFVGVGVSYNLVRF